jgi:hypothetical protein
MRHFLTLLLLAGAPLCFGQIARDSEFAAPIVAQVEATQSHDSPAASPREESKVYICDSQTAKAYHSSENCRGPNRCTHAVVKVTKKEAEEEYGRGKCQVCY